MFGKSVTTPTCGLLNTAISRSKLLSLFLTTLYQQDIESGQEHVILLVVAGVVTGMAKGSQKRKRSTKAEGLLGL